MRHLHKAIVILLAVPHAVGASVIHVDATAAPGGGGTTWGTAFDDLQNALLVAQSGDEIWTASGTYKPSPPAGPPAASFVIPSGVAAYGGFAGDETLRNQRDPVANVTTLSGDLTGDGFSTDDTLHVVTMLAAASTTRLDGFEVVHGYGFFGPAQERRGAGLFITGGSPTIANCGIIDCLTETGGGAFITSSDATFDNCRFNGDVGSAYGGLGGAMYIEGPSNVTITDCDFTGNEAEARGGWSRGGAIYSSIDCNVPIERCNFYLNNALHRSGGGQDWCRGGAIYCLGNMLISHSTFRRNVSNVGGAVEDIDGSGTVDFQDLLMVLGAWGPCP